MGATGNWFVFDGLGRLTEWQTTTAKAALCLPDADQGYNCPFDTGSVTTYTYDAVGHDTLSGNATYGTGNRLTSWNGTTFENDANGARTRRCSGVNCATRDIRYGWSNENLLARVVAGTDTTYYDYNAFGVLVRKRKNGNHVERHFLWEGGHLLAELDSTARGRVSEYAYYPGTDRPLALITGVDSTVTLRVRSILQDEIGNVTAVVDVDSVYAQFAYDPWGVVTSSTGSASSVARLGWKGLLYEGDSTQLYYMRNRWYDATTRRFISEDPIGLTGGINLFVFASNDPVNRSDPLGLTGDVVNQHDCGISKSGNRVYATTQSGCVEEAANEHLISDWERVWSDWIRWDNGSESFAEYFGRLDGFSWTGGGGHIYDRRVVGGLRAAGDAISVKGVAGTFFGIDAKFDFKLDVTGAIDFRVEEFFGREGMTARIFWVTGTFDYVSGARSGTIYVAGSVTQFWQTTGTRRTLEYAGGFIAGAGRGLPR
jgi:RHS repeat-associated protein